MNRNRTVAAALALALTFTLASHAAEGDITTKLKTKVSFIFADKKLVEAVQDVAKSAGVTITVDPVVLKEAGQNPITFNVKDMEAGVALSWILKLGELEYVVRDKDVLVAKPETIEAEKKKTGAAGKK